MKVDSVESAVIAREPVPISPRVHWIGALDPTLRLSGAKASYCSAL